MAQLRFGTNDSVGSGTTGTGSAVTINFAKSALANMVIGDLLVAWIHNQSSASSTITPPSGWTHYGAAQGAPSQAITRASGFYYYALKSQADIDNLPATITWTFTVVNNRCAGVIARATGIDLDNIEDTASTAFSGGSSNPLVIAGINTTKATTLLVAGVQHQNAASTTSPSVTSMLTAFQEYKTAPTGSALANSGAAMGYSNLTSSGATGNVSVPFDSATASNGGELVAFQAGVWGAPPPARPTIVGTPTTFVVATAVTSFTIDKPTGLVDGDILILALSAQTPTATSDFTSTGWVRISKAFEASNSGHRIIAFYVLKVPTASALAGTTTFTFTSTDSATGGRIAAEMFIVRGADLTSVTSATSPIIAAVGQSVNVNPDSAAVNNNLLLVGYNAQFTSAIDYTIASGPSAMTQQIFLPSSTGAQSKTILAVYQQDIDAGAVITKTLTYNGVQSQGAGNSITIRALGAADPNAGVLTHYTSAPDTLVPARMYYTSATDTLSTPLEARPFPNGYASVSAMLAATPFHAAHRGGSSDWPEMSLYGYTQSGFWGVGALEVSLARTSDGVWFGLHDSTLDRTSGTSGFTASAHTWAEVQAFQITAAATNTPGQPARPYMRWEELMAAYYNTHVIFVDPKSAISFVTELLNMMDAQPGTPTNHFIAKYYGVLSPASWTTPAHARGYQTWGYFYQADSANFAAYQGQWDILGMDYNADQATWTSILSYGKPVIGHIIPNAAAATIALNFGAAGLMVSGIQEALTRSP